MQPAAAGTPHRRGHALTTDFAEALGTDLYLLEDRLTDEERAVRDKVRAFCDPEVIPIINDYWERGRVPVRAGAQAGDARHHRRHDRGLRLPGHEPARRRSRRRGAGARRRQRQHLPRRPLGPGDGQSSRCSAARSRSSAGCPPMARLDAIGAFALTEPDHGSDAVALETQRPARRRRLRPRRREALDRQRPLRRRRRSSGRATTGRRGRRLPGREGTPGFDAEPDHRQDGASAPSGSRTSS